MLLNRQESFTWGRISQRLGRRQPSKLLAEAPQSPIGAKLEITYACNLRCGFCYTDSPRRTLQRTPELSDEQWGDVVDESLDLGIVEAVVTGGEPLLRRDLTLGIVERLAQAGVGVTLNTNGWFVDADAAARLGTLSGVTAHISVDGARPGLHDSSRGVPGSWKRAIEGIDHLLSAGVGVCVVHVVTPENEDAVPELLEQVWALGVTWVRMTPVVQTGAAARGGEWGVSRSRLRKAVDEFREDHGPSLRIDLLAGTGGGLQFQGQEAPGSYLVRPNGDVRPDSLRPFTFGNAIEDGVATCWERIRDGWADERINRWAGSLKSVGDMPKSDLVAYLDDEVDLSPGASPERTSGRDAPVPAPTPPKPVEPAKDLSEAREKVMGLALGRRYRTVPLRMTGGPKQRFVRLGGDGSFLRLNESGALVMDKLDGGSLEDAVEGLSSRYGLSREQATRDALAAIRDLQGKRVLLAEGASGSFAIESGTSDLPGLEPNG